MTRRHSLHPLPRAFAPHRSEGSRRSDEGMWEKLDRVQVLGGDDGHVGCVNALSWSDDGRTLLSGSDDRRICIWQPDPSPSSSSSSSSPHPLKLMESISTGHRANIFSAKFLPNANTPTIVSCAGDREVRVFEVERLGREESGGWGMGTGSGRNRGELFGHSGDGVRVLRCHTDRTKRIATENSPFLFLTVSEDGTVRQHDLRRPHVCRSECPEALFYAPKGVDLYSLSVSTVTPHIFAVAGRTEHVSVNPFLVDEWRADKSWTLGAYICDRRMLQRQTPTWGPHARASGQVHCVRKLGLPDEEWSKVTPDRGDRFFREERHTTCVKMSAEHADEVVVAFAKHSTSLFSIYDSPPSDSARARSASPTIIPPNREADRARQSPNRESGIVIPSTPTGGVVPSNSHFNSEKKHQDVWSPTQETKHENEQETLQLGKRRLSDRSTLPADLEEAPQSRLRTNDRLILPTPAGPSASGPGGGLEPGRAEEIAREMGFLPGDQDNSDSPGIDPALLDEDVGTEMIMGPPSPTVPSEFRSARDFLRDDLMDLEEDDRRELNFEGAQDATLSDLENMAIDLLDEDDENELDAMDFDEEDEYDEDDEEEDDEDILSITAGSNSSRVPAKAFDSVETIFPRRSFKGARNMETVKDCNFLGTRSDKVCSGSDDGNFFVWDKDTGRLEDLGGRRIGCERYGTTSDVASDCSQRY